MTSLCPICLTPTPRNRYSVGGDPLCSDCAIEEAERNIEQQNDGAELAALTETEQTETN